MPLLSHDDRKKEAFSNSVEYKGLKEIPRFRIWQSKTFAAEPLHRASGR
jgi:hypothetical protein